ncbi:carboxypeptidase regulatory-like domain-containing protein [Haloimpatiens sp. FM7330]|uniref:carboxypeptidase regulatory-like domain-containing protein n=1 Tax=Haloimpatiens sp. FM7330 TaxID=3298610 RepID=UPI00363419F4
MGAQLVKFKFTPKENQQIEALVKIPEEKRSVIHGTVIDRNNKPVKNAVVKLLLLKDPKNPLSICSITHTFTDVYGQFLFGPLCPNKCYVIKIWYNDVDIKPLIVKPQPGDSYCLKCTDCSNYCDEGIESTTIS